MVTGIVWAIPIRQHRTDACFLVHWASDAGANSWLACRHFTNVSHNGQIPVESR
jgi:hypothetical protein